MSKWEIDFSDAVAALEAAFMADRQAYEALIDDTKNIWALWPVRDWPETHKAGVMVLARQALIQAENTVRDLVQRQSIAIRNARARRHAIFERRAFAITVPGVLAPELPVPRLLSQPRPDTNSTFTAASRARNPSTG